MNNKIACSEEIIFRGVLAWGKTNTSEDLSEIMSYVRLPLLPIKVLSEELFPLKLVSNDRLVEAFVYQNSPHQFDKSLIQFQPRVEVKALIVTVANL